MAIKEVKSFWELYFFVQFHPAGSFWFGVLTQMFALPLCILDYRDSRILKLGAYHHNKLVGLIVCSTQYERMDYLYIKKKYRKQGIASKLIDKSKCEVVVSSPSARPFWKKKGFTKEISRGVFIKWD